MVEKISLLCTSQQVSKFCHKEFKIPKLAPKLRLRAGWGVNELIKEHALDSDTPNWGGNSFF